MLLNFQEQQILGVWARCHAFDGSTDYIVFRADRTACDWEEPNGSSSKTEYGTWTWSISGSATSHPYTALTAGAGINYVFDYPAGDLWPQVSRRWCSARRTARGNASEQISQATARSCDPAVERVQKSP